MPEGDTIAAAANRLRPLLVGEPLLEARHRGGPVRDLVGLAPSAIDTHGKHMWIRFDPALALHIHLGMEGGWSLVSPAGLKADPSKAHRAALALVNRLGAALCTWAPTVQLVRGPDASPAAGRARLGPDILAGDLDVDAVVARARAAGRQPLGEVLLDQRVVAGIGNLWKSELCFLEALDPRVPVGDVAPAALRALFERAARMMAASVGQGPRTTTTTPGGPPPADLGRYWAYRKADRPCPRCGVAIVRILQGISLPRSTYFCPSCQIGGRR